MQGAIERSKEALMKILGEVVRSGSIRGLHVPHLADTAFDAYVVDRVRSAGGAQRVYLRPKVPFGASPCGS
jgi:hypothetical protein